MNDPITEFLAVHFPSIKSRDRNHLLTSYDRQAGVLRPRHHRRQLGWTQNQHVQKAAVGRHHQHRRLLQVRLATFHLHPEVAQAEEDGSAQRQDDRVEEPAAPALYRSRALLLGQAGQSQPGNGPHDEEEERRQEDADGEEDAAEDDALGIRREIGTFFKIAFMWCQNS